MRLNQIINILDYYLNQPLPREEKIRAINLLRQCIHQHSEFRTEPVDCVEWVREDRLLANDYNPNHMAPVEFALLKLSLVQDGFTQPLVVTPKRTRYQIVDGYHRYLVATTHKRLRQRLLGYLPVVKVSPEALTEQMASTIRHNRARGRHQVGGMSSLVQALADQAWPDEKIGLALGMEADEVLRLKQRSSLIDQFKGQAFSEAWTTS